MENRAPPVTLLASSVVCLSFLFLVRSFYRSPRKETEEGKKERKKDRREEIIQFACFPLRSSEERKPPQFPLREVILKDRFVTNERRAGFPLQIVSIAPAEACRPPRGDTSPSISAEFGHRSPRIVMNAIEFMCQRSLGYHGILCHIPTYVFERNWSYTCTLPMDGHFVRYQEVKSQTTEWLWWISHRKE